jgi:hypothetical protein
MDPYTQTNNQLFLIPSSGRNCLIYQLYQIKASIAIILTPSPSVELIFIKNKNAYYYTYRAALYIMVTARKSEFRKGNNKQACGLFP